MDTLGSPQPEGSPASAPDDRVAEFRGDSARFGLGDRFAMSR